MVFLHLLIYHDAGRNVRTQFLLCLHESTGFKTYSVYVFYDPKVSVLRRSYKTSELVVFPLELQKLHILRLLKPLSTYFEAFRISQYIF